MENLKSAAKKAVGTKAVLRALASKEAARVYVASDIDTFLYQKVTRACAEAAVPSSRPSRTRSSARFAACKSAALPLRCSNKVSPLLCQIVSEGCGIFWI